MRTNEINRLLGGHSLEQSEKTLKVFWDRYKAQFPSFQLFQDPVKSAQLQNCLPLYIHGDEGTTYKKKGVLIVAWQSAIGAGSRNAPNQRPSETLNDAGIPVNLLKTALQTRYVSAVCPKETWCVPTYFLHVYTCYATCYPGCAMIMVLFQKELSS